MKRNIVINSNRTALVISDYLADAIKQVAKDTYVKDEIFAFDTQLHICYAYIKVENGYSIIETEVPLNEFRNFKIIGNTHEIYTSLINSFIK